MPGIQVFKTLADALRAGYSVYDRTETVTLCGRERRRLGMAILTCLRRPRSARNRNKLGADSSALLFCSNG